MFNVKCAGDAEYLGSGMVKACKQRDLRKARIRELPRNVKGLGTVAVFLLPMLILAGGGVGLLTWSDTILLDMIAVWMIVSGVFCALLVLVLSMVGINFFVTKFRWERAEIASEGLSGLSPSIPEELSGLNLKVGDVIAIDTLIRNERGEKVQALEYVVWLESCSGYGLPSAGVLVYKLR